MKGVLFNYELGMFDAVVSGAKTQTRRIIKLDEPQKVHTPRYKKGEFVYLKEPYHVITPVAHPEDNGIFYKYDLPFRSEPKGMRENGYWKNKMFMPEKYARHYIVILEVKAQLLDEITESDALAEGCPQPLPEQFKTPIDWYKHIWEKINGKNTWRKKIYLWAYEFEILREPNHVRKD